MTHLREHWEGVTLPGEYTLKKWLGGDDSAAFFQTELATDGRPAVVKLVPEAIVDGAALLDLWHRTRQLRHPNLIELLDCGRADHRGEIVLYAVFESPDDTLASALSQSPLDPCESREVLVAMLDALRYLHAQGLVAGALDPDHIVAVGDRIKLSTGALRYAETSAAYREDIRLLGELWKRALLPASPRSSEIADHAADPNPQTRWNLAEITAALTPPPATPPLPLEPAITSPPVFAPPISAPALVAAATEAAPLPPSRRRTSEVAVVNRFPRWIFVGAAGILLLILGLNLPRHADVATESQVSPVLPPAGTPASTSLPKAAAPLLARPSPVVDKAVWRVIAFTYRTRDAAARKVQQLNQHHPGLNAAVFSPKNRRGYYLVSLGGRMTHDDALRMQRGTQGKGLPRDLYVQNYSE